MDCELEKDSNRMNGDWMVESWEFLNVRDGWLGLEFCSSPYVRTKQDDAPKLKSWMETHNPIAE